MNIRNRVKSLRMVPASDLRPNPKNWRTHPKAQQDALRGVLAEVGLADACLARELPDGSLMLIDGHLRAETLGDGEVPVLVLDVTEAEADKLLATLDPLAAMAETDAVRLDTLLRNVDTGSEALQEMFAATAADAGLYADMAEVAPPELADGDRAPFRQMTFTIHDTQHETIEEAIAKAKKDGGDASDVNENTNGNALAFICKAYLDG
jgi:ParB-like chromosome segregation protein Spo0J